jgi:hypothetical protein
MEGDRLAGRGRCAVDGHRLRAAYQQKNTSRLRGERAVMALASGGDCRDYFYSIFIALKNWTLTSHLRGLPTLPSVLWNCAWEENISLTLNGRDSWATVAGVRPDVPHDRTNGTLRCCGERHAASPCERFVSGGYCWDRHLSSILP